MLSSAWPLLSLSFLWLCLAIGFAILLTMNLTQCLFNIFITQVSFLMNFASLKITFELMKFQGVIEILVWCGHFVHGVPNNVQTFLSRRT